MPDLIQFWPEQQRYRMIEVKGPGDRLQDNQLRWIDFCTEHGLPIEVCHVRWIAQTP
ncbi:VRR-NUC domain protein [compost metagenome]